MVVSCLPVMCSRAYSDGLVRWASGLSCEISKISGCWTQECKDFFWFCIVCRRMFLFSLTWPCRTHLFSCTLSFSTNMCDAFEWLAEVYLSRSLTVFSAHSATGQRKLHWDIDIISDLALCVPCLRTCTTLSWSFRGFYEKVWPDLRLNSHIVLRCSIHPVSSVTSSSYGANGLFGITRELAFLGVGFWFSIRFSAVLPLFVRERRNVRGVFTRKLNFETRILQSLWRSALHIRTTDICACPYRPCWSTRGIKQVFLTLLVLNQMVQFRELTAKQQCLLIHLHHR